MMKSSFHHGEILLSSYPILYFTVMNIYFTLLNYYSVLMNIYSAVQNIKFLVDNLEIWCGDSNFAAVSMKKFIVSICSGDQ